MSPPRRAWYSSGTMNLTRKAPWIAAAAWIAAGCAGHPIPPTLSDPRAFASEPWKSPRERQHPLVGYALSVRDERWIDAKELAAALSKADFVFLGETHDNEDHHRLQARLLRGMLSEGRRPALALEMFDTGQAEVLARALASENVTAETLAEATGWKKSGWPDFALYRPIFEAALEARLALIAANLPRSVAREVVRKGLEPLPADVRALLAGAGEPSSTELAAWAKEMEENHCQELPKELLDGLVRAQRARDAQMALQVAASDRDGRGAVLITGDGHARSDRGVPAWLAGLRPGRVILSIALVEADPDRRWPRQYAEPFAAERFPFDYVIFTPRAEREDPCEQLRRHGREAAAKAR